MTLFSEQKRVHKSITMNPLIADAIKKIAKANGRTFSNYLEMLAKQHLEELQKGKQKEIK
jgi:hypothetical protein